MKKHCDCGSNHDGPLGLSRRQFIKLGGAGVSGYALAPFIHTPELLAQSSVTPLNTASACIFVMLMGGPSHMDTFDVKEGPWTPKDFQIATSDNINLPTGLFPNLSRQTARLTVVRSVEAWVAQHNIAQYWIYTAQDFNPAFTSERPGLGAVVAMEYQSKRSPGDVLPGFVALNSNPVGSGFLSAMYAPFNVTPSPNGVTGLTHPDGETRFNSRWNALQMMDAELRSDTPPLGKPAKDYNDFYNAAKGMMYNPVVTSAFRYTTDESQRYGNNGFGNSCIVARNLVSAKKGARFVFLTLNGWDMHTNIYGKQGNNIYSMSKTLDSGLGMLISDLAGLPGRAPGKTLLDETIIVTIGDFGRTPPDRYNSPNGLNNQGGRDHFPDVQFALFAGGGVKGGQAIGITNETGSKILDYGWSYGRSIRMEDISTTIYSAMNINWTKEIKDTPSHRVFQYVPYGPDQIYKVIDPLFG